MSVSTDSNDHCAFMQNTWLNLKKYKVAIKDLISLQMTEIDGQPAITVICESSCEGEYDTDSVIYPTIAERDTAFYSATNNLRINHDFLASDAGTKFTKYNGKK